MAYYALDEAKVYFEPKRGQQQIVMEESKEEQNYSMQTQVEKVTAKFLDN